MIQSLSATLPETADLARGLAAAIAEALPHSAAASRDGIVILERAPNQYASTFPSERVRCRIAGDEVRLFCKYDWPTVAPVPGHRGGVASEAAVYRHLLRPLVGILPTARYVGHHLDRATGATWLFIEDLGEVLRVGKFADASRMVFAARWAGRFHALHEGQAVCPSVVPRRYDEAYYASWARRAAAFVASAWGDRYAWFGESCKGFQRTIGSLLLDRPTTVIHGEYYPSNVLASADAVYPVDWESAAIAAGEIDLASLTEHWPAEVVDPCEAAYRQERWPRGGEPADFANVLNAARLYLHFRWLGERPEAAADERQHGWRFDAVRAIAERLGFI